MSNQQWKLEENWLSKKFSFENFHEVMGFINAVAFIANKQNHHPNICLSYNSCIIKTTTHDAENTVTEKDYLLTDTIDLLLS